MGLQLVLKAALRESPSTIGHGAAKCVVWGIESKASGGWRAFDNGH
ncbi:MAG: hypothetical protein M1404_00280 [Acidobacteria bacterium]|nr:hypothetical protein [Acidobacteriota bacterium]